MRNIFTARGDQISGGVSPVLSKLAQGFGGPKNLIGPKACVDIPVATRNFTLRGYDKSIFVLRSTERAIKAIPQTVTEEISASAMAVSNYALGTDLDKELEIEPALTSGNGGAVLNLEKRSQKLIHGILALEKEYYKSLMVFGTSYYNASVRTALSGTDQWTDKVNSTPIDDIETGFETARTYMGQYPNTITMGVAAWLAFSSHPTVLATLPNTSAAIFTPADFARLFSKYGTIKLNVGLGVYAAAADSSTFTDMWGASCAMTYVPDADEMDYAEGLPLHDACFNLEKYPRVYVDNTNPFVKKYYQQHAYVVASLNTYNGYLYTGCA